MKHDILRLDARWFTAFVVTIFAMHELHELAHTWTGRLICGSWPLRDFNRWSLTGDCSSWLPSLMGPLFSYLVVYAGAWILVRGRMRMVGLGLLFGANPFARLFTAIMGGGDEMILARVWAGTTEKTPLLRVAVISAVALLTLPALFVAWRSMRGMSKRALTFSILLLSGIFFSGTVYMLALNGLLSAGVMARPVIVGEPLLVFSTTVVVLTSWVATWRWLAGQTTAAPETLPFVSMCETTSDAAR